MKYNKLMLTLLLLVVFVATDAAAPLTRNDIVIKTKDRTSCFPEKLWGFLEEVQNRFGRITIVSGHRGRAANKRRRGAKKSAHINCLAADFRVPGAENDVVLRYLESNFLGRAGIGFYCNGRFHLDVGRPRTWGGCQPSKNEAKKSKRTGKKGAGKRSADRSNSEEVIPGNSEK